MRPEGSETSLTRGRTTRRALLEKAGAVTGVGMATSLAGCTFFADHASYWSDSGQVDVDYDGMMAAARDAGYEVVEPYYVGARDPRGVDPEGIATLDELLGPEYRVFGVSLYHTEHVFIECWFTGDEPRVSLFDDRVFMDQFPLSSVPPESWLVEQLTRVFDVSEGEAADYAGDMREQVAEGTEDAPSVDIDAAVTFETLYDHLAAERTDVSGSDTGGDGWYKETSLRDDRRIAAVDFIVQSMEVRHRDGDRRYTLKLDRLGGFYLHVQLPVGEEIPEDEYRDVFREMFGAIGLPPAVVDDLEFEYEPSIW